MKLLKFASLALVLAGCRSAPTREIDDAPPSSTVQPVSSASDKPFATPKPIVSLNGVTKPTNRSILSVRMPQRISAVLVRNGQTVKAGDLLIAFDDSELASQSRSASAAVDVANAQTSKANAGLAAQIVKADADIETAASGLMQARTRLSQAQIQRDASQTEWEVDKSLADDGVKKARAALSTAQATLHGLEELAKVGGVARQDLEGAGTQVKVAEADVNTASTQRHRLEAGSKGGAAYKVALAQKDVDLATAGVSQAQSGVIAARKAKSALIGVGKSDVQAAKAGAEQARAGASGAVIGKAQSRLLSPIDGVVTSLTARIGETAQPGMALLAVQSARTYEAEALASSRQRPGLKAGDSAIVTTNALGGAPLEARVVSVSDFPEADQRSYRVRFRLNQPLSPGMSLYFRLK